MMVFFFLTSRWQPFMTTALNHLEIISLATSLVTIYCGLFFASSLDPSIVSEVPELQEKALMLGETTKLILFIIILVSNAIFFVVWLIKLLEEIKHKLRSAFPRVYLKYCLCNDESKLEEQRITHQVKYENETLKEEFFISKKQCYSLEV